MSDFSEQQVIVAAHKTTYDNAVTAMNTANSDLYTERLVLAKLILTGVTYNVTTYDVDEDGVVTTTTQEGVVTKVMIGSSAEDLQVWVSITGAESICVNPEQLTEVTT